MLTRMKTSVSNIEEIIGKYIEILKETNTSLEDKRTK